MQRRTWLRLGLASATALAVGGGALALWSPGLAQGRLSAPGRLVFTGVGRAMLDGTLPAEATAQTAALDGLLARIDALVGALPAHARDELSQLLALLSTAGGRIALAGLQADWPEATVPQLQESLQSMRVSSISLRQQAYHALHDITFGAYFSDPSTWTLMGYPGPIAL